MSAAALLAACGDPELPEPPETPSRTEPYPVTPVVAVDEREARPQAGAPIVIGVPTGNPLFDQVSLRVTGLAADATRNAEAPGELSVVQFEQALTFDPANIATAIMPAVGAARAIPGPYATPIKAAMLREIDAPIASGQTGPFTALTAAAAINKLFEQSAGEVLSQGGVQVRSTEVRRD